MKFEIELNVAKSLASLINFADKANSATPVLQQVRCYLDEDGGLTALATDRYVAIVAGYDLSDNLTEGNLPSGDPIQFGITHDTAKFLSGIKPESKYSKTWIRLEIEDNQATFEHGGQSIVSRRISGNYPPIGEHIAKWQHATDAQPVKLNLTMLTKASKIISSTGEKLEQWVLELGKTDSAKPGPIRGLAGGFTFIQQPNLIK